MTVIYKIRNNTNIVNSSIHLSNLKWKSLLVCLLQNCAKNAKFFQNWTFWKRESHMFSFLDPDKIFIRILVALNFGNFFFNSEFPSKNPILDILDWENVRRKKKRIVKTTRFFLLFSFQVFRREFCFRFIWNAEQNNTFNDKGLIQNARETKKKKQHS